MDTGPSEKQSVKLTIFNRSFSVLVSGDPSEIEEVAQMVDDLIMEVAKSGNYDTIRIAVFAALQLGLRLRTLEKELSGIRQRVDEKSRDLTVLLDGVIEESEPASD